MSYGHADRLAQPPAGQAAGSAEQAQQEPGDLPAPAGEPRGLQLAHSAITDVTKLGSVRVRRELAPLVQALEARSGSDARELAGWPAR